MASLRVNPDRMRRYITRTQPRRRSHPALRTLSVNMSTTMYEDWLMAMSRYTEGAAAGVYTWPPKVEMKP